jgi:predicted transcriptional regulator
MTKRTILISICSMDEFKKDVRQGFQQAKNGLPTKDPIHRVFFTTQADLFSTLSPKRMELLKFLKKNGPLSCRNLAAELKRSYANVHADVQQLIQLDLIEKNSEERLIVPWDELDIAVPLVA